MASVSFFVCIRKGLSSFLCGVAYSLFSRLMYVAKRYSYACFSSFGNASSSITSHSERLKSGKNASAFSGVSSISVRHSMSAMGIAVRYSVSPPIMYIISSLLQLCRASSSELNVSQPGKELSLRERTMFLRFGNAPFGSERNVLLPMMIVCPVVSSLKRLRSFGSQ